MRETIILSLKYDRWSYDKWEAALTRLGIEDKARPVMEHILESQRRWLQGCGISVPADAQTLHLALIDLAANRSLEEVIDYRTAAGATYRLTVQEILLQVIFHGVHHRGQIRGMVLPSDFDSIPDTDFLHFISEDSREK